MKTKIYLLIAILATSTIAFSQIKVANGGRVGIGTNDLSNTKLNVNTTVNGNLALKLQNYNSGPYGYQSLGITTHPYTKCWAVQHNNIESFRVYADGNVWCKVNFIHSDSSLKRNIIRIENSMQKLNQLRGVSFKYKTMPLSDTAVIGTTIQEDTSTCLGFIAQEVEAVVPAAVRTDEFGVKAVNYAGLIGLLVEAIKEQQTQINNLQNSINNCCGYSFMNSGGLNLLSDSALALDTSKSKNVSLGKSASNNKNTSKEIKLFQNQPNPFSESTSINFEIPSNINTANIFVYNFQGQQIKKYSINQRGKGNITINSGELAAGTYYYTLIADQEEIATFKMILTN